MGSRGRRQIAGMERTPSGAISRSKTSIAKRAEVARQAAKDAEKRAARVGRTLQERTQQARARAHGLTAAQSASHNAESIEGRLYLKNVITRTELLAVEHYQRTLARFARESGTPGISGNPLARYIPSDAPCVPRGTSSGNALAQHHYDDAQAALARAGAEAASAIACVCRRRQELPEQLVPAFVRGVIALVGHYRLGTDPDREARAKVA